MRRAGFRRHWREGKPADVAALLADAEKAHPSPALVMQHAMILAVNGDAKKGAALLKTWLAGHPNDANARRLVADLDMQAKDGPAAQDDFEKLIAQSPNDVVLLNDLAWVYLQQGNVKARAMADRAHALAPLSAAVEDTLGWVMVAQGDAKAGCCPISRPRPMPCRRTRRCSPPRRRAVAHRRDGAGARDAGEAGE